MAEKIAGEARTYRKSLGLFSLVSLGVGGTIGSGIFVVPGIAAGIAGPGSLLAWAVVAVSATCVALSLSWTASRFPSTGAFYGIFSRILPRKPSTALALLYLASSVLGLSTIAAGLGQYFSFFGIRDVLPLEVTVIAALALLNLRGIYLSSRTENLLTVLKTVPLVVLAALLVPHIRPENFVPLFPSAPTDFLKALVIVYWPFTGFEIVAIPAEETRDPKLVGPSLAIVMGVVGGVYLLLTLGLIGSVGSGALAASPAPVADAAGRVLGGGEGVVAVVGVLAMLSALNAYLVATSRVMQNLTTGSRVARLGRLGRRGTPVAAIVAGSAAGAALLLFSNRFSVLASAAVVTTLLPYLFVCVAAGRMFPEWRRRVVSGVGALSTIAILVLSYAF